MDGCQPRASTVWGCEPADLGVLRRTAGRAGPADLAAAPAPRRRPPVADRAVVVRRGRAGTLDVAASCELVWLRIDPPVDMRYLHTTYLLDLAAAAGVRVVNRPAGVRALHEKLIALHLPELCPATVVTSRADRRQEFVATHGAAVLKPVDGFAGTDVWLLRAGPRPPRPWPSRRPRGAPARDRAGVPASVAAATSGSSCVDGEIVGAVDCAARRTTTSGSVPGGRREPSTPPTAGSSRRCAPRLRRLRHRARRARRHRRPPDRGQRHLPRRHAQDRRPARHRPLRRDLRRLLHPTDERNSCHEHAQIVCIALSASCSSCSAPTSPGIA